MTGRIAARLIALAVVAAVGASCAATSTGTGSTSHAAPAADTAPETLHASELTDSGLPARLGPKPTPAQAKLLVQYLEDRVNAAYAHGDPRSLTHYLAGPMLTGNRATILVLDKEHRHNVVAVRVRTLKIQTAQPNTLIVDMRGRLTKDYFVDSRNHRVLAEGLPGPSPVHFLVFLNRNPATRTWYWTGEQAVDNRGNSAGTTSGGAG